MWPLKDTVAQFIWTVKQCPNLTAPAPPDYFLVQVHFGVDIARLELNQVCQLQIVPSPSCLELCFGNDNWCLESAMLFHKCGHCSCTLQGRWISVSVVTVLMFCIYILPSFNPMTATVRASLWSRNWMHQSRCNFPGPRKRKLKTKAGSCIGCSSAVPVTNLLAKDQLIQSEKHRAQKMWHVTIQRC